MNPSPQPAFEYVIFDRKTGRILQRHSRLDVTTNTHVPIPIEELKRRFSKDTGLLARTSDRNPANLDFLEVKSGSRPKALRVGVDVDKRQLVELPHLAVKADKPAINGNGTDKLTITVEAVDPNGKLLKGYGGQIKVTTTRGKLSAPGGVLTLTRGSATIELTAVNETVSKVRVGASAPDGSCSSGYAVVEFL